MTLALHPSIGLSPSAWMRWMAVALAALALTGAGVLAVALEGPAIVADFTTDN